MPAIPHNIERALRGKPYQYRGYAKDGTIYHISRVWVANGYGQHRHWAWQAIRTDMRNHQREPQEFYFTHRTLALISQRLEQIDPPFVKVEA